MRSRKDYELDVLYPAMCALRAGAAESPARIIAMCQKHSAEIIKYYPDKFKQEDVIDVIGLQKASEVRKNGSAKRK